MSNLYFFSVIFFNFLQFWKTRQNAKTSFISFVKILEKHKIQKKRKKKG